MSLNSSRLPHNLSDTLARLYSRLHPIRVLIWISVLSASVSTNSALATDFDPIVSTIRAAEQKFHARIGVAIYDVANETNWSYHGDSRFPILSTFKTLACAKLLHAVDNHDLNLKKLIRIKPADIVSYSPVMKQHIGNFLSLTEICAATMTTSDNAAANIILTEIGGPAALTQFLRSLDDRTTILARIEPELNEAVPLDVRDTTSPNSMVSNLNRLLYTPVLSPGSRQLIKDWLIDNAVADALLRSVLPANWSIADRTGAGNYGSRAITAIVWSRQRSPLIIAIYLTETEASMTQRNQIIVDIGQAIFNQVVKIE